MNSNESIEAAWLAMKANVFDELHLDDEHMHYVRNAFYSGSWTTMRRISHAIQEAKTDKQLADIIVESMTDVEAEFREFVSHIRPKT